MVADPSSTAIVEDSALPEPAHILNVNVGVLGHVDSGKTSLVKALSTLLSTAGKVEGSQRSHRPKRATAFSLATFSSVRRSSFCSRL